MGLGFRGWLTMFYLGFETRSLVQATVVATWSSGYITDITYCTSFRNGKRQCTAKTWNSRKHEIVRDQKQANYISINWHCKKNTSANHQALEKTSTQFQSPPSPQNTAYYIEQLSRPHFYNLAHGNRTSVLIHSSHAWLRVHEPNPLWHCKKRKR